MYMEVDMEQSHKTTILLSPELRDRLRQLARQRGTSLGQLIREACISQYGLTSRQERLQAVDELAALQLPVAEPGQMKRESVPEPEDMPP
jgi:predicted transcriptional regulator